MIVKIYELRKNHKLIADNLTWEEAEKLKEECVKKFYDSEDCARLDYRIVKMDKYEDFIYDTPLKECKRNKQTLFVHPVIYNHFYSSYVSSVSLKAFSNLEDLKQHYGQNAKYYILTPFEERREECSKLSKEIAQAYLEYKRKQMIFQKYFCDEKDMISYDVQITEEEWDNL